MQRIILLIFLFTCKVLFGQQTERVDFLQLDGKIKLIPEEQKVQGELHYSFQILGQTDSIYLDAKNMQAQWLKKSDFKGKITTTKDHLIIHHRFKKGKKYKLSLSYEVIQPKQSLYFVGWENSDNPQIWSQGQGKDTSYWLPVPDDANDKLIFNLQYEVPSSYTAIGNGELKKRNSLKDSEVWTYEMSQPMSSYLVAVAVGKYQKETQTTSSGIPLEFYFEEKDAVLVEPTYRHATTIFDFLEKEIGFPYPWQNYKQIPVRDFLYAGMENTGTTIFSEALLTDSIGFIDRNFVNVQAHELAHQWFGNLVTQKSGANHWLHEGFATYYALLAEKQIFGEDYFYLKLFEKAEQLQTESDKGKGRALVDPNAGSLTFYDKGAWAVHVLREKLGASTFRKGIQLFLQRFAYQNVSIDDFIHTMEESSGQDLSEFVEDWLKQSAFQAEEALQILKQSDFITEYMEALAVRKISYEDKSDVLNGLIDSKTNTFLAREAVYQLPDKNLDATAIKAYRKALYHPDLQVRQMIAANLAQIPVELKKDYEALLEDASYLTREYALLNLWSNFTKDQTLYLDRLKGQQGFYDHNIHILWLTLALATPNYDQNLKPDYYKELSHYTFPSYDYSIRQNAFSHLYQLDVFTDQNYLDLMQACVHPVWRFRNFGRELLEALLKENPHRQKLLDLEDRLSEKEQKVLQESLRKIEQK